MAICKFCAQPFAWGSSNGKWVPLIPLGEEGDADRTYQDENGQLRAEHAVVCANRGGPSVRVERLVVPVPAEAIIGALQVEPSERQRRRKGPK